MPSLGGLRLYTPIQDVPSCEVLTQTCLRAFLGSFTGAITLRCGIFLLGVICSAAGMSPFQSTRFFANGMCLHSEDRVCTYLDRMCPRVKVLTQTRLRAFLGSPTGTGILCCEIFPTRSLPLCCRDVPPLRALVCSTNGMCPHSNQTSLWAPII